MLKRGDLGASSQENFLRTCPLLSVKTLLPLLDCFSQPSVACFAVSTKCLNKFCQRKFLKMLASTLALSDSHSVSSISRKNSYPITHILNYFSFVSERILKSIFDKSRGHLERVEGFRCRGCRGYKEKFLLKWTLAAPVMPTYNQGNRAATPAVPCLRHPWGWKRSWKLRKCSATEEC